jgi:arylsulfatase
LALFAAVTVAGTPALAQQQKPNILFIMGDDIGWMQPSIYHRGLMVGETPNIDRIGQEGAIFMDYVAMQSCTSGRNAFFTGMYPLRTGMIPPQLPGSPSYLQPGTPAVAKFLLDLGYTTGEFGKNHLGDHTAALPTAHGFQEYWGYLYHLDAMQQVSFSDINASPTVQSVAPPCRNTPIPGVAEVPGAVDPKTTVCLTPPRPVLWSILPTARRRIRPASTKVLSLLSARRRWTRRSPPRSSTSLTATIPRRPASPSSSGTTRRACTS